MTHSDTFARLLDTGIIPIMRISDAAKAVAVANALIAGNIPVLEISLSLPGSLALLEAIADTFGDTLLLGAGTVLDASTVRDATAAGARYIVAPNLDTAVIDECMRAGVPVIPGALTPTEIARAMQAGADAVKVFPCNAVGGPDYIRALLAPFPLARLFPCGGVNAANAAAYFAAGARAIFAGSSLINKRLIEEGRFSQITQQARSLAAAVAASRRIIP
jgi:2-dehydro-3-deoxyphosphogluconate aldolase/(4S)-4-hydroxy-2-oxoglutarate aldolase